MYETATADREPTPTTAAPAPEPPADFVARHPILSVHWPDFPALVQAMLGDREVDHHHVEHRHEVEPGAEARVA